MINQQLLDFIKQQLQLGSTKEKISVDLISNGWTAKDVEEGFKTINPTAPIQAPVSASTLAPDPVSSHVNYSQSVINTKVKTHFGLKIFFIILILFLLACGASAYYFRNDLVNIPFVKNFFANKNVAVSQNILSQTNETQAPAENTAPVAGSQSTSSNPNAPSVPTTVTTNTDCGTFNVDELSKGNISQSAEQVLTCLNNALETCHQSTGKMSSNKGAISFAVVRSNETCAVKLIVPSDEGNFDLVCPFSGVDLQSFFSAVKNDSSVAPTSAVRDSMKGAIFVNSILISAGAQMVKITYASSTVSLSFNLSYSGSTMNCSIADLPSLQPTVFNTSAINKATGVTYSNLVFTIPPYALAKSTNVTITSLAATDIDAFIGGFYIINPDGTKLQTPATVSITYNDAAVTLYRKRHPDFIENNLTLAYYDNNLLKYFPIPSTFDSATRTASGKIPQLYGGGIMIFPVSFFNK